ncbi:MAG: pantoate--beta-alanine ligase [Candidatus Brocadiia bacterium]
MEVYRKTDEIRSRVRRWHEAGLSVGLVPTMGALHEGHLNLIRGSDDRCDRSVVSVFVNPTQFGEDEDLEAYPRRLEEDVRKAEENGAEAVFAPSERCMYPAGYSTFVIQEQLTDVLCGRHRPGHFRGVLTIVTKLFNICEPERAFFGRKDFQQSVVLRRMTRDLNFPVELCVLPTVRESDGLAVSSRNEYLSPTQREEAVCLYRALREAQRCFQGGERSAEAIKERMQELLDDYPQARVEYLEIVSPDDLQSVEKVAGDSVAALAVYVGETRLIDNMPLGECQDIILDN